MIFNRQFMTVFIITASLWGGMAFLSIHFEDVKSAVHLNSSSQNKHTVNTNTNNKLKDNDDNNSHYPDDDDGEQLLAHS